MKCHVCGFDIDNVGKCGCGQSELPIVRSEPLFGVDKLRRDILAADIPSAHAAVVTGIAAEYASTAYTQGYGRGFNQGVEWQKSADRLAVGMRQKTLCTIKVNNSTEERVGVAVNAMVRLIELAHRQHYNCEEDTFYGCPKSAAGCCDDRQGAECNCGADTHNTEVDKLAFILLPNAGLDRKEIYNGMDYWNSFR